MHPQSQVEPRIRKRVPCTLRFACGREHAGMVLNLSRGGLFVQTGAHVAPGDGVTLELNVAPGNDGIPVGARVLWRPSVAPQLRSVSPGGFGVRIKDASEAYLRFLDGAGRIAPGRSPAQAPARAAASNAGAPHADYRVRLKQTAGPRTRWVRVRAASETDAGQAALREAGAGWAVLECCAEEAPAR